MAISFRGKTVDMVSLAKKNEKNIALGNAGMNGRGDIIEHGKVVKTREEYIADWYANNTVEKEVTNLKETAETVTEEIAEEKVVKAKPTKKMPKYEDITDEEKAELEKVK